MSLHEPMIEALLKNLEARFPQQQFINENDNNERILQLAIRHDERHLIKQHIREWYDSQMKLTN